MAAPQQPYRPKLFTVGGTGAGESGKRSRAITETGRRIGAQRRTGQGGSIHLIETIRAAAPHQYARGRTGSICSSAPTTCASRSRRVTSPT